MIFVDGLQVAIMLNSKLLWNGVNVAYLSLLPDLFPVEFWVTANWFDAELPRTSHTRISLLNVTVYVVISSCRLSVNSSIVLLEGSQSLRRFEINGKLEMYSAVFSFLQLANCINGFHGDVEAVKKRIRVLILRWIVPGAYPGSLLLGHWDVE